MIKDEYKVVGVMSGTSLDGVDFVYATFKFDKTWHFKIIYSETIAYNSQWVENLRGLVSFNLEGLKEMDNNYTNFLSMRIAAFINKFEIKNIDAICSHGHTALHRPEKGLTYQIGNMPHLAVLLEQTVVCDFRVQDVELGGQGAPLVPIGDRLLFSEYDFCLNLGGFANISTEIDGERIAYDVCPVNIVLNSYVKQLGFDYDDEGKIASTGTINDELLEKLNNLEFYKANYPKSLGLEWVDKYVFPLVNAFQLEIKDVLKTFVEHVAIQLACEINKKKEATVLATGGGVYNAYLVERLEVYSKNKIIIPSKSIVEFKEALIFGFLGVLKIRNEVNCLKSVTGASKNHSSGRIYLP
ncbi:anhydro-N-acetylmuramic acid kinase [Mariniflexile litorale]|uniref:Anhydro-N-acetylmuramic acid kinase n=1 Tax=Mariniflexile litorale TaxID=3045158 RepID=A0AAU7ECM8_9FLAO|nr:anhydro-N-acetylmuramic acid kinase [Mariniflexile sp. KMM 9835]MDQ8210473.1 anhydro-N-acetylmuramic acid kinase [Mariniflexile sp. KMM 9835]